MSISFEAAISTLKTMFPEWDEEMLSTLLIANNYHVERTIETVLTMNGDTNIGTSIPEPTPAPIPMRAPVPAPTIQEAPR
jgi:hypothetical protein